MINFSTRFAWVGAGYAIVIAVVLYPALHEGFGPRISTWNCIPPTLGAILVLASSGKTMRWFVISLAFAAATAAVAIFFFARWFFTPIDTDPHSITTKLVFIYAPLFSLALAALSSGVAWFLTRPPNAR